MTRTRRGDGGQATVELALALPLVALLVLVVLQAGLVLRDQLLVAHAAREAARAAAVSELDPAGAAHRAAHRSGDLATTRLRVSTRLVDSGERVAVHVRYDSSTDVPLVGVLLPDIGLTGDTVMRVEATSARR